MKTTSDNYQFIMSKPFRPRSRMAIVLTTSGGQFSFTDDEIITAKKVDDVDPLARRLPKHTFEFTIEDFEGEYDPSNPQGKWELVDKNASLSVVIGQELNESETEWLTADEYRLTGKPTVSNGVVSFSAVSILSSLTNKFYKIGAGSHTYYQLAEAILQDAGITNYYLSSMLSSYTTTAPLPVDTSANLLQMIAHATSCVLSCSRGRITIAPLNEITYNGNPLTLNSIAMNGDKVSKIEPLYKVQANKYTYTSESTATNIYEAEVYISGSLDYHCEFNAATDVSISTTATVSESHIYARACDLKLTGNGSYTITITGKKINAAVDMQELIEGSDVNGGVDLENNALVTNDTTRTRLLTNTKNYLLKRITHEVKYRGSPELEALDGIYLQSEYGYSDSLILNTTITYNGALSGSIIAKEIQNTTGGDLYDSNDQQVEDYTGDAIQVIGSNNYTSEFTYEQMNDFCYDVLGG